MPLASGDDQATAAGEPPTRPAASKSRNRLLCAGALLWHRWETRGTTSDAAGASTPPPAQSTRSAAPTFPFGRRAVPAVAAPDSALANDPVVASTKGSVLKIRSVAPRCGKVMEGSGFVVAPNRVMSNAHVVAGSETVTVEADGQLYDATVVSYDPNANISILDLPNLPAPPLQFAENQASIGTDAIVVGYPGGGDFVATPARVREIIELSGPDIYRTTTVTREVYTIRGTVRQGNSGSPMIDRTGKVLGVVFGAAVDDADTGFVLTAKEVSRQLTKLGNTERVATGACVGG